MAWPQRPLTDATPNFEDQDGSFIGFHRMPVLVPQVTTLANKMRPTFAGSRDNVLAFSEALECPRVSRTWEWCARLPSMPHPSRTPWRVKKNIGEVQNRYAPGTASEHRVAGEGASRPIQEHYLAILTRPLPDVSTGDCAPRTDRHRTMPWSQNTDMTPLRAPHASRTF